MLLDVQCVVKSRNESISPREVCQRRIRRGGRVVWEPPGSRSASPLGAAALSPPDARGSPAPSRLPGKVTYFQFSLGKQNGIRRSGLVSFPGFTPVLTHVATLKVACGWGAGWEPRYPTATRRMPPANGVTLSAACGERSALRTWTGPLLPPTSSLCPPPPSSQAPPALLLERAHCS